MTPSPREAHAAAIAMCAATAAIDAGYSVVAGMTLGPFHRWLHAALALQALALGGWLVARRARPSVAVCDGVYLALAIPHLVHVWLGVHDAARLEGRLDPLMPAKLLSCALALLAPGSLALAAALVTALGLEVLLLWHVLELEIPLDGLSGEPWLTLLCVVVALGLIASRAHARVLRGRVARAQARVDTIASLGHMSWAMRERLSGPLAILEEGAATLREQLPELSGVVEPLNRATGRLRDLWTTLAAADAYVGTTPAPRAVELEQWVERLGAGRGDSAAAAGPAEAHSRALAACVIVTGVSLASAFMAGRTSGAGPLLWLDIGRAMLVGAIGLGLASRSRRPSAPLSDAAFAAVVLLHVLDMAIKTRVETSPWLAFDPLLAERLRLLGIALLTPANLWLGALLVAINGAASLALWRSLGSAGYPLGWDAGEPWLTLLFVGLAWGLLALRWRSQALAEDLARARARGDTLASVARLGAALRDRANTPLQTLELGTALLAESRPETVAAMREAAARVRDVWATLELIEVWGDRSDGATPPELELELADLVGRPRAR